jgi:hypothetical protein
MKTVVNVPRKKWIGRGWIILTAIMAAVFAFVFTTVSPYMSYIEKAFLVSVYSLITVLFAVIIFAYYRTKYVIENGTLRAWSPFMAISLPLKSIKKVERTRVPYHLRVGASDYCGIFYIPGVGWTRTIMTNVTDGLLIYAKGGRKYLITPSHPDKFARVLKR